MTDENKDKSKKKNKVNLSEGVSHTRHASMRSTTKDTEFSTGDKRENHCRMKAHVAKGTSEVVTPPSQGPTATYVESCSAFEDEDESDIDPQEQIAKAVAQAAANVRAPLDSEIGSFAEGAANEDQNQSEMKIKKPMLGNVVQAVMALDLAAKGAKSSSGKRDKRQPKSKIRKLMLEAALQTTEGVDFEAKGAGSSNGHGNKHKPKMKIKEPMLKDALQPTETSDFGANGVGASPACKGKSKRKQKTAAQIAANASKMAVSSEVLSVKNSELSITDTHKSNSKKRNNKKGSNTVSATAGSLQELSSNDAIRSIAGIKSAQRIVEDCKSVASQVPSSKLRSRRRRRSKLSDKCVQEFLPIGNCLHTDQQKAFAEAIRQFLRDVPDGKVFLGRLKKNLDPVLLSHPSVASNDTCMGALIFKMVELGIKVGQERSLAQRIGARLWNSPQSRSVFEQFRSLARSKDAHPLDDSSKVQGGKTKESLKNGGNKVKDQKPKTTAKADLR